MKVARFIWVEEEPFDSDIRDQLFVLSKSILPWGFDSPLECLERQKDNLYADVCIGAVNGLPDHTEATACMWLLQGSTPLAAV